MNLEELKLAKASKQSDISAINKLINIEENKEYNHFIGKYFQLSATSIARFDNIEYIDDYNINFTGLHIHGGIKFTNEFRIHTKDNNHLSIHSNNKEITKEQFIDTINVWYEEHRLYILNLLDT